MAKKGGGSKTQPRKKRAPKQTPARSAKTATAKTRGSKKATSKKTASKTKKATSKKAASKTKKTASKKAASKKAASKTEKTASKKASVQGASAKRGRTPSTIVPPLPSGAAKMPKGWGAHSEAGLSSRQLRYLYNRLVQEKARKLDELQRHMEEALGDPGVMPDETDMAQRHTEQAYLIRFADKERKLLNEIERALEKLRLGEYGVCEGTEEPIGFKRLELRPWTRYSVAYKEQIERERSQHRR